MKEIRSFWDERARLGDKSGTNDRVLKLLEIATLKKMIKPGSRVLDVGCGTGELLITMAATMDIKGVGLDFSEHMISVARQYAVDLLRKVELDFKVHSVVRISDIPMKSFDYIVSERCLINLVDWETQKKAITDITHGMRSGAKFLMMENSSTALGRLNVFRKAAGLKPIEPPWHNRYISDKEINSLRLDGVAVSAMHFSSSYYYNSRIVNAWQAALDGEEPNYQAPINSLSLNLPALGQIGQTVLWVFTKS